MVRRYLHLAGRTGRQGRPGSVVTLCPGRSSEQLRSWGPRLGEVRFEELRGAEDDGLGELDEDGGPGDVDEPQQMNGAAVEED